MSLGILLRTRIERVAGDPGAAKRLAAALRPATINPIVGRSGVNTIREHLFGLNGSRPNKLGGKRTNFFADAARGTSSTTLPDGALVSINQVGIRLQFKGGTVRAGANGSGKKWLTIPARAEAHGKRAREFNDLRFVIFENGAALIRNDSTTLKRKRDRKTGKVSYVAGEERGGEVMFWLKRSVTKRPDPTVLPYPELLTARLDRDVASFLDRRIAGAPASGPSSK